ncbi:MAG TPA: MaoC/PaaZ C-terminal domain-containing protein [Candidatus Binatia bacterium]|jgi:NAD(P)-dependent dehydrogenase (short-subunit alcohol dehydrogenase family)
MAERDTIDERTYGPADQERFAALSGDRNPIHLDALRARREMFGAVVVHGMHLLLRALDAVIAGRGGRPVRVRGQFPHPAFLGTPVTTRIGETDAGGAIHVSVESAGQVCMHATVEWSDAPPTATPPEDAAPSPAAAPAAPRLRALAALADTAGDLDLWLDAAASARDFPRLHAALGGARMAEILALTRLIGMECPGLRSIFSAFDVTLTPDASPARALRYRVERVIASASFVRLRAAGGGIDAQLDAFVRPPPEAQSSYAEARTRVSPAELAAQRALVVGGGRGLGEVAAKLVAAGGGHATVTWTAGREDAERVAAEIVAGGGSAGILHCDVARAADLVPALARLRPTHVYYFASPKIFVKRGGPYDPSLYARFTAVYVEGLEALVAACRAAGLERLRLFIPSSTVLDEPVRNLEEYADAKAAAEARCALLARRGVEVTVRRLPRVATDQTLTLVRHPAASALDILTPIVRGMSDRDG